MRVHRRLRTRCLGYKDSTLAGQGGTSCPSTFQVHSIHLQPRDSRSCQRQGWFVISCNIICVYVTNIQLYLCFYTNIIHLLSCLYLSFIPHNLQAIICIDMVINSFYLFNYLTQTHFVIKQQYSPLQFRVISHKHNNNLLQLL